MCCAFLAFSIAIASTMRSSICREEEQAIETIKQQHRAIGAKHVDLWVQGSLYPPDPRTTQLPTFSGLTSFIKYVCEGQEGLWGYTSRLACQDHHVWLSIQRQFSEHKSKVVELTNALKHKHLECKSLQDVFHDMEITNRELSNDLNQMRCLQTRLDNLTAMGPRERVQQLKPLHHLVKGSGQWKHCIKACKSFKNGLGFVDDTINPSIAKVFSKDMLVAALQSDKFKSFYDELQREKLEKVSESFTSEDVQALCDKIRLCEKLYAEIWQQVDNRFKYVYHGKRVLPFPRPSIL